jgi:glycosyltransferase involved in cell wall biosynthesis
MRTLAEARWFRQEGYDVQLIAPEAAKIAKAASSEGFTVLHRELTKGSQIADFLFCYSYFKNHQPLMVGSHSNIDTRVCLAAAHLAKVPNRFRYRHVSIPVRPKPWNKLIYRKFATRIITTAERIARPLREHFHLPDEKVVTIATGIQAPSDLPSRENAHVQLCHELQLPESSRFIGQVSILRSWKGHADVMKAFDKVANDFPDYHLVFVGGGHGEDYLPPIAASLPCKDRIHFLGHKPNPWPYFRALDIATLASTEGEGIPQSGMQAMLCGAAFIGTDVGGIPEIVTHKQNGLIVPPSEPDAIATAFRKLLKDPNTLSELTSNAQDWANTHTSLDRMGNRVEELLSK